MEVRGILQAIGMEATVLAFLFGIAYAAIRISIAERRTPARDEETYSPAPNHQQFL